jgi:hypothetical protein
LEGIVGKRLTYETIGARWDPMDRKPKVCHAARKEPVNNDPEQSERF